MHLSSLRLTILGVLFALCLGPAKARAQEPESSNPLAKGQWAFEFGTELFDSRTASFSARRHFSAGSALQLDFLVRAQGFDRSADEVVFEPDTTRGSQDERNRDTDFRLGVSYVCYPRTRGKALLFLSGGPFFLWSHDSQQRQDVDPTRTADEEMKRDLWGVGGMGKIGFDWFFAPKLSLGSRYGVSVTYTHRTFDDSVTITSPTPAGFTNAGTETGLSFDMTQLLLGISFYP